MSHLAVIVGIGGINPAGRSSFHHSYRRLVINSLPQQDADQTLCNLAVLMGLIQYKDSCWQDSEGNNIALAQYLKTNRKTILENTLIRKLEKNLHNHDRLRHHLKTQILSPPDGKPINFSIRSHDLPQHIPENWRLSPDQDNKKITRVEVTGDLNVMLKDYRKSSVQCAGQLPSGFKPDKLYPSRNHPRGLQLTVFGASDALDSMGIDWKVIRKVVAPDQISVYAGSSMSQLDYNGNGGMLQARLLGKKVTSKQLPLGFGEMPADFINAYLLGNIGSTGASLGACASFHYNLCRGIRDIQNGTHRVVIVGGSEAPLIPEIIEGYANMGALVDDKKLLALDAHKNLSTPDHRRASRPFGENAGFTLGESAQFIVLFDDALTLELGANIYGAVNDVFINADGFKKSIASPGIGNYITVAKAVAATKAVLGETSLRNKTFMQAHGTSTPQNRVTESAIFSDIARQFGIENWPVSAVKSFLGHSLCTSGADQLVSSLGVWKYGIIPGILTTEAIAEDVSQANLDFLLAHKEVGTEGIEAILLNAKGFGGNNATVSILSPVVTKKMLAHKHGKAAINRYESANEKVQASSLDYDERSCRGLAPPTYKFDHDVKDGSDLDLTDKEIKIRGYGTSVNLNIPSRYPDMSE